jgi:hypothetical protein
VTVGGGYNHVDILEGDEIIRGESSNILRDSPKNEPFVDVSLEKRTEAIIILVSNPNELQLSCRPSNIILVAKIDLVETTTVGSKLLNNLKGGTTTKTKVAYGLLGVHEDRWVSLDILQGHEHRCLTIESLIIIFFNVGDVIFLTMIVFGL